MKPDLRSALRGRILTGDGAMGTYLYQLGFPVGVPYEEFNLLKPDIIKDIHRRYYEAGARIIETNTFSASRDKLSKFGLEDEVAAINTAGVALAREAVGDDAYVLGAVGSLRGGRRRRLSDETVKKDLTEQLSALLAAGVDGILFETFYELAEMRIALGLVRGMSTDVPVLCQFATDGGGVTQDGVAFTEAFRLLAEEGADAAGFNCHSGPAGILRAMEKLTPSPSLPLTVFPNAGLPGLDDGRVTYRAEPEYFASMARRFADLGASVVGGCCGTTPEHVAAIAGALSGYAPEVSAAAVSSGRVQVRPEAAAPAARIGAAGAEQSVSAAKEATLLDLVRQRHTVIVELDSPRDLAVDRFMEAAGRLKEAGVDAVTMADNSLAMTRISNVPMGHLVRNKLGLRPLLHVACRDRNAIGTQSHLMGMHALGINHVLAVTGDPSRFGDLPDASSVYDMNSLDLIRMTRQLNEGVAFSGKPLKQKANFVIGAAFDPNVKYLGKAVERMEKKIEAGAHYFMTQPVYDAEKIEMLYEATKHLDVPIFLGIMPLASGRNAEFLHNEVPGIRIPEEVRRRMAGLEGEEGRRVGVDIAKELLDAAIGRFRGIYLMTPMFFTGMTGELAQHVWRKTGRPESALSAPAK